MFNETRTVAYIIATVNRSRQPDKYYYRYYIIVGQHNFVINKTAE